MDQHRTTSTVLLHVVTCDGGTLTQLIDTLSDMFEIRSAGENDKGQSVALFVCDRKMVHVALSWINSVHRLSLAQLIDSDGTSPLFHRCTCGAESQSTSTHSALVSSNSFVE